MRPYFLFLFVALAVSCQNNNKNNETTPQETATDSEITKSPDPITVYPKSIGPIFEAHGGIANWNRMNNLCFEIVKEGGNEIHSTDLNSRKTRIENPNWTIGFDGDQVWLKNKSEEGYGGNARFYHNLYFYFYAMPFIVSDPGITYKQLADPLVHEGKKFIGTRISYKAGIGDSPEDEYTVYKDPATGKMAWLSYTVTFNSGEKSDNFRFIKYDNWQEVNGLLLPKTLTWYNLEEGLPTTPRSSVEFTNVNTSETVLDAAMFTMPEGAVVAPR